MTDLFSLLLDPLGATIIVTTVVSIFVVIYLTLTSGGTRAIGFERVKPGFVVIHSAKLIKKKDESDYKLKLKDRNFTIPKEKLEDAEILQVKKSFRIKKGIAQLFPIENGQVVAFNASLSDAPDPLMDNETVSAVVNRSSARRLSKVLGGLGSQWTMLLLAGAAAFAVGYILYPMFNHPAPLIECYRVLSNGSRIFQGYC